MAHLELDSKNAYNDGDRVQVARSIASLAPSHFPYFSWLYQHEASLFTVDRHSNRIISLKSSSGVRQGDVLASLWYCIGARSILDNLTDNFPLIEVYGYADNVDVLILKPPLSTDPELNIDPRDDLSRQHMPQYIASMVNQVMQQVHQTLTATLGTKLQLPKCSLYIPNAAHRPQQHQVLPIPLNTEGSVVLGTPVGSDQYVQTKAESILNQYGLTVMQSILQLAIPKQDKMILLRSCVASIPMQFGSYFVTSTWIHSTHFPNLGPKSC